METTTDNVLNVTLIQPQYKHATIFARYEALKGGEHFILLNDHDPRPLYFQLVNMHGETFDWEYLEKGPQWFRIKITKKGAAVEEATENGLRVLNVTLLEPRVKHPTIFEWFDKLDKGEGFILLNDHDPKPLYYQLLNERGEIFNWEYLEKGPQWWKIKIDKKLTGKAEETLGEIATKDLTKAKIFKKYGLDFCCGGNKTVREACEEKGIDVAKVAKELEETDGVQAARPLPYNDWNLDFLADYVVNTHHSYIRKNLPDIRAYADKVFRVHGKNHAELARVRELVEAVNAELMPHLDIEERDVFPFIKKLVSAKNNSQKVAPGVQSPIQNLQSEHEALGKQLEELRSITKDYLLPADACASYSLLYRLLNEFEDDIHLHIHLENNILFPKAIELEKSLA